MKTIFSAVQAFIADEDGVTAIEYGLLAALIGIAMAAGAETLGSGISAMFTELSTTLADKLDEAQGG